MKHLLCFAALFAASACSKVDKVDKAEALNFGTCRAVVIALAKNPSSARIPQVRPWTDGKGRVEYSWRHGDGLALANGFGGLVDTTLSCVLKDGALYVLVLDGKQVNGEQFDWLALAAAQYRAKNVL